MERRSRLLCCAVFLTATIVLSVVTYILVFQSPDKILSTATPYHVFESKERECANTFQGRTWITDDKGTKFVKPFFNELGVVCHRNEIDPTTGCCQNGTKPTCNQNHVTADCAAQYSCCTSFETCVSCCLRVNFDLSTPQQLDVLKSSGSSKYAKPASIFDFCLMRCRTSSSSVVHQNTFRSQWKYCYGSKESPLLLEDQDVSYTEIHDHHRDPK
jgi:hypothetical protein